MDKRVLSAHLADYVGGRVYVKQEPYVGEDGIYVPCEPYALEGCSSAYNCIITKELFIEAYNKWIKGNE